MSLNKISNLQAVCLAQSKPRDGLSALGAQACSRATCGRSAPGDPQSPVRRGTASASRALSRQSAAARASSVARRLGLAGRRRAK